MRNSASEQMNSNTIGPVRKWFVISTTAAVLLSDLDFWWQHRHSHRPIHPNRTSRGGWLNSYPQKGSIVIIGVFYMSDATFYLFITEEEHRRALEPSTRDNLVHVHCRSLFMSLVAKLLVGLCLFPWGIGFILDVESFSLILCSFFYHSFGKKRWPCALVYIGRAPSRPGKGHIRSLFRGEQTFLVQSPPPNPNNP